MSQKGFSNIAIWIVAAIFILGIGGYFIVTQKLKTETRPMPTTKTASSSLPLQPIVNKPTKNACTDPPQPYWLSFTNKDYGFQLKYPPFICDDYFGKRKVSAEFNKTNGNFNLDAGYEFPIFSLNIYPASSVNVMTESLNEWAKELAIEPNQIINLETLNFNNAEMRRIIFKYHGNTMGAKFFVKIRQYIFESSVTGENTTSPDFFKNYLSWKILSMLAPYN